MREEQRLYNILWELRNKLEIADGYIFKAEQHNTAGSQDDIGERVERTECIGRALSQAKDRIADVRQSLSNELFRLDDLIHDYDFNNLDDGDVT